MTKMIYYNDPSRPAGDAELPRLKLDVYEALHAAVPAVPWSVDDTSGRDVRCTFRSATPGLTVSGSVGPVGAPLAARHIQARVTSKAAVGETQVHIDVTVKRLPDAEYASLLGAVVRAVVDATQNITALGASPAAAEPAAIEED